jgi:hypothetical protein
VTFPGALGEMVTYQTAAVTGQDDRGNDVTGFTNSQVGPCAFVPGAEAEAAVGTEQVTSTDTLYMPPGTPVSPLDRILRGNGETYEITGEASTWSSPFTGIAAPVKVSLRRVTGATAHLASETNT